MTDKKIEAVKNWPEPTSVKDIQVFIGFVNFYQRFIRGFSRIAVSLTSILKITGLSVKSAPKANVNKIVGGDCDRVDKTVVNSSFQNSSYVRNIRAMGEPNFLTLNTKKAFNRLRQVLIKAPILRHFDSESHIRIETDASSYAISGVLNQLNFEEQFDFGQWHPVVYFFRKMISIETRYKTHDIELLAIVQAFMTWRHDLEGYKHEPLVLTDHNNLR